MVSAPCSRTSGAPLIRGPFREGSLGGVGPPTAGDQPEWRWHAANQPTVFPAPASAAASAATLSLPVRRPADGPTGQFGAGGAGTGARAAPPPMGQERGVPGRIDLLGPAL